MKKYRIEWTETAHCDLEEIVNFIAVDDPVKALAVLDKIETKANNLTLYPERGRLVPELREADIFLYHELIIQSWRVIYRFEKNRVFILAVLDGRRGLSGLLLERLLR